MLGELELLLALYVGSAYFLDLVLEHLQVGVGQLSLLLPVIDLLTQSLLLLC